MNGLGQSIFEEGREQARQEFIQRIIQYNLKDHASPDTIIKHIQNYTDISPESAKQYYQRFSC